MDLDKTHSTISTAISFWKSNSCFWLVESTGKECKAVFKNYAQQMHSKISYSWCGVFVIVIRSVETDSLKRHLAECSTCIRLVKRPRNFWCLILIIVPSFYIFVQYYVKILKLSHFLTGFCQILCIFIVSVDIVCISDSLLSYYQPQCVTLYWVLNCRVIRVVIASNANEMERKKE